MTDVSAILSEQPEQSSSVQWVRSKSLPDRGVLALLATSFLLCCFVVLRGPSPFGDLSGIHTDHLRHSFAAWIFLHEGVALFQKPFEALWDIDYPHPMRSWGRMAFNYPPGSLLLFLPLGLAGKHIPMDGTDFGRLAVCFTVALSHWALWAIYLASRGQHWAARTLVLVFGALHLLRAGLEGFYDGAWIAMAAHGVSALRAERPEKAIYAFLSAALLHYRAIVILPLGVFALWQASKGKTWSKLPWLAIAAIATTGAICLTTFLWMYPTTTWYQTEAPSLLGAAWGSQFFWVCAMTLVTAAASWRFQDPVAGWTVLAVGVFCLVDVRLWWHATAGLVALWSLQAGGEPWRRLGMALLQVAFLIVIQHQGWGGTPNHLFRALKRSGFWWS
jgi:hypothetical protein